MSNTNKTGQERRKCKNNPKYLLCPTGNANESPVPNARQETSACRIPQGPDRARLNRGNVGEKTEK